MNVTPLGFVRQNRIVFLLLVKFAFGCKRIKEQFVTGIAHAVGPRAWIGPDIFFYMIDPFTQ